jgi:geranylgeranyl diphosphate synthase, type I
LCAGLNKNRRSAFHDFGFALGLAFQVLDDWLGIWGDASLTGKSTEGDLMSGKKTLPVLYGLEHSPKFAQLWERGSIEAGDLPSAVGLLDECGANTFTISRAEELTNQALSALDRAVADSTKERSLRELTSYLLQRNK